MKCVDCEDYKKSCPGCGRQCDHWLKDAGYHPCKACADPRERRCRFAPVKTVKTLAKAVCGAATGMTLLLLGACVDFTGLHLTANVSRTRLGERYELGGTGYGLSTTFDFKAR